jgi:hypothetical protein
MKKPKAIIKRLIKKTASGNHGIYEAYLPIQKENRFIRKPLGIK